MVPEARWLLAGVLLRHDVDLECLYYPWGEYGNDYEAGQGLHLTGDGSLELLRIGEDAAS